MIIRKQFHRTDHCFENFLKAYPRTTEQVAALREFKARYCKSKSPFKMNMQFYDPDLYLLFMLKFS